MHDLYGFRRGCRHSLHTSTPPQSLESPRQKPHQFCFQSNVSVMPQVSKRWEACWPSLNWFRPRDMLYRWESKAALEVGHLLSPMRIQNPLDYVIYLLILNESQSPDFISEKKKNENTGLVLKMVNYNWTCSKSKNCSHYILSINKNYIPNQDERGVSPKWISYHQH